MITGIVGQSIQSRYVGSSKTPKNMQNNAMPFLTSDTFIKQDSNISFTGFRRNRKPNDSKVEKDIASALKNVSMKGMPFLLGLATSAAMVKMGDGARELLFDEDGYSVDQNGITSDLLTFNENEGVIKFEGTGIEIDADNCDVVDWENGVFRKLDGSIDIDLGANKFIDLKNGIFVDPEEKISAILDGENFENIAIPHFPSFGSGYPTCPWDDRWGTIQSRYSDEYEQEENIFEKAASFIKNLFGNADARTPSIEAKDIFGNDIIVATDNDGDAYLASTPNITTSPIFAKFQSALGADKETAIETFNNMRLQSYLNDKYPSFGTRVMVYEGGRNAGVGITPDHERSNPDHVKQVLDKISQDGSYYPEPGSEEAISFAKYQNVMLKNGLWQKPLVTPNLLLDIDGDGKPDIDLDGDGIPDYDKDGDGIIDFSSESSGGILGAAYRFIKGLLD